MEVLRSYSQIVRQTQKVLSFDISEVPILDEMKDDELEYIAQKSTMCEDTKEIHNLSELVFQLNNYSFAIVNYVTIFLYMEKYGEVMEFISKMFASHFATQNYTSKQKQYNASERLFDRFIEIVNFGKIEQKLYLPLVLKAIFDDKSKLYIWHDIAMEYMQTFMRENQDLGDIFSQNDTLELEYLSLLLEFNTQKGISIIFNNKDNNAIIEQNANQFLKAYIADTLAYFDKNLPTDFEQRFHYIKVLSAITNNSSVETRLDTIYESEQNDEIKTFLAQRLGISKALNFGTQKHFKVLAQKKVDKVQERVLGVAFENLPLVFVDGEQANDQEKTYLVNILKEENNLLNLYSLTSLYSIFEKKSLHNFAEKLFDKLSQKDDINSAKWCVRMFSLFSDDLFERKIYEFLYALYRLNRKKEALYLTNCLLYSKKQNFMEMLSRLRSFDLFCEHFDEFVKIYSQMTNIEAQEIKDLTLPRVLTDEQKESEIQRLYQNFISGRKYSKLTFKKLFIEHPIFNDFAQRLVFGEYKAGKLYSVFFVSGKDTVYIYGNNMGNSDKEVYVSLVHSLDLDERFDHVDLKLSSPLFEQFSVSKFDVKSFNMSNLSVGNYYGTIVEGEKFAKNLQEKGFLPNKNDGEVLFDSFVAKNDILNILVEIELQKAVSQISPTMVLGNIRFYRLSECMLDNQKYITNKSQSLSLAGINNRYFDYVISVIR